MIKSKATKNPVYLSATIILIVIVAVVVFLHFHNKDIIPTTNPVSSSKTTANNNEHPKSSPSASASDGSDKNPASQVATVGTNLAAPYGTFVSDHHPSLSGANNTPSSELSTCTTSPGASCYINFTKGDVTKRLPTQITDGSGSTSWHWDVSQAGLSQGTWDITAVATLGDQTKSTSDTFKLEVQP